MKRDYGDASCPFCGGADISEHYIRDGAEVRCKCGASVHKFQPNALIKAREAWRTRVGSAPYGGQDDVK